MERKYICCTVDNSFDVFPYSTDVEPINPATGAEQEAEEASFQIDTLTPLPMHCPT